MAVHMLLGFATSVARRRENKPEVRHLHLRYGNGLGMA